MRLADRLRAALDDPFEATIRGDAADHPGASLVPAAVLIAVTDRPEPGVLLTLRHANLRRHAGQIAFPGGRVDPEDEDGIAAALREADEEIGLPPHVVELAGTSDRYWTGTGYDILPVVGVVPPDLPLVAQEAEVADLFEVPLAFLLERANHAEQHVIHEGRPRSFHEIAWGERRIWGATANMIVNLSHRLAGRL